MPYVVRTTREAQLISRYWHITYAVLPAIGDTIPDSYIETMLNISSIRTEWNNRHKPKPYITDVTPLPLPG